MASALWSSACQAWVLDPAELDAASREACRAVLSDEERARADRFYFERDRATFTAAHALVRLALSRAEPAVAPREWTFAASEHGRPEVAGEAARLGLRFNLSHTRGLAGCVVTRGIDCGFDLETLERDVRIPDLARMVLADSEREDVERTPAEIRRERFLRYWTVKEAYSKARGLGLLLPVKRVAFDLGGEAPRLLADPTWPEGPEAWRFQELRPTVNHLLALALRPEGDVGAVELLRPSGEDWLCLLR